MISRGAAAALVGQGVGVDALGDARALLDLAELLILEEPEDRLDHRLERQAHALGQLVAGQNAAVIEVPHGEIDQKLLAESRLGDRARRRGRGLHELLEGSVPHVVELDEVVAEPPPGLALQGEGILELLLGDNLRLDQLFADSGVHRSSSRWD